MKENCKMEMVISATEQGVNVEISPVRVCLF